MEERHQQATTDDEKTDGGDQLEEVAGNQRGHGSTGEGSEQAGEDQR